MASGTGSFFKGTTHDQDVRFENKEKKLMQSIKWPEEFDQCVDLSKVIRILTCLCLDRARYY